MEEDNLTHLEADYISGLVTLTWSTVSHSILCCFSSFLRGQSGNLRYQIVKQNPQAAEDTMSKTRVLGIFS